MYEQVMVSWVTEAPQIQLPPTIQLSQQETSAINAGLVNIIQTSATNPGVRIFMFNTLAQNGFNNQAYRELLIDTCIYAGVLKMTGEQRYIERATRECVQVEIARFVTNNQVLLNYMGAEGIATIQQYQQMSAHISNTVRQVQMQMQQQPQSHYPSQMGMGQTMGMPQPVGGYNNHYNANGGGMQYMNTSMQSMMGSIQPQQQENNKELSSFRSSRNRSTQVQQEAQQPSQPNTTFTNLLDTTRGQDTYDSNLVNELTKQKTTIMSGQFFTEEPPITWYYSRIPPVLKMSQILITEEGRYGVREAMSYEELESCSHMIKLHRDLTGFERYVDRLPSLRDIAKMERVELDIDTLYDEPENKDGDDVTKIEDLNLDKMMVITTELRSHSKESILVDGKQSAFHKTRSKDTPFTITGWVMYPIDICDINDPSVTAELFKQSTLTRFIDKFDELRDSLDISGWSFLHDRLLAVFNKRLSVAKIDAQIEDLVGDYSAICDLLATTLSVTALDRFRDTTLKAMMLSSIYYALPNSNKGAIVKEWGVQENISITYIPVMSNDLNFKLSDEYSLLSNEIDHSTYALIKGIFKQDEKAKVKASKILIVTKDNIWMELHNNDFDRSSVIISKHK